MNLSDAIDDWNTYRKSSGFADNTVKSGKTALGQFLAVTGNIQVRNVGPHHGEMFLTHMLSKGYSPKTVNLRLSMVKAFSRWCRERKLMTANQNPLSTTRKQAESTKPRRRVPVHDFPRLLDAADRPQARILIALGLYLFNRASEATFIKLGDVDLEAGEIRVWQQKTKQWDLMPICAELDAELRRWLTWYAQDQASRGPLDSSWFLVPSYRPFCPDRPPAPPLLNPERKMSRTSERIHQALEGIGWEVSAEDMEGCHTLRRSGARALFDDLVSRQDRARDDALRIVSSMLHHKSVTQTEVYLGLEADREKRDVLFKGQPMFAAPAADNVVTLKEVNA